MRRVALGLLVFALVAGCVHDGPGDGATPPTPTASAPPATTPTTPTLEPTPVPQPPFVEPLFDGEEARDLVERQVLRADGSIRHRVPGTGGNAEVARMIAGTMDELGYSVSWHHFNATYGCETTPMHNVIAERAGTSGQVVVFAAHYDTRPIAEKDPDESRRDEPIPGANDGASGVAVLMELARVTPPKADTVRFVFFDGEDGGGFGAPDCHTPWIIGSTAYNASLADAEREAIRAFILVDMVGDTHLEMPWELYSRNGAGRSIQDRVYAIGHGLGHMQFRNESGHAILDDHKPFVDAGVPAIDLIHLVADRTKVFPDTHHTHADSLENVSAESLAAVGRTLETWWRQLPDHP